jgi:hypothetical protein
MKSNFDVIIIGAGLSGLAAAITLQTAGREVLVCEAGEDAGGRVRTDLLEGFRLDRGFQVLFTAYPEARRFLDYSALRLRPFYPGALVRFQKRWHRVTDPFRHPLDGLAGLFNPIGSFADKCRVGRLRMGWSCPALPPQDQIMLNGEGAGPINNLAFMTAVSTEYASRGKHLVSVSVIDRAAQADPNLPALVRSQLTGWFGSAAETWRHLRTYSIPEAVPAQPVVSEVCPRVGKGLYRSGDYCGIASINAALGSGRLAAEAILKDEA